MEVKNLSPLKGSWLYIWISNDECKKNSTDLEKVLHSDKEKDQKDEEIKKKFNFEIIKEQCQLNESSPNIPSTSYGKVSIGNELKSDDANNEINDETKDKTETISINGLNTEEKVKEQEEGEKTDIKTIIVYIDTLLHEIDNIIEKYNIDVFTKQIVNDKTQIQMFVPNDIIEKVLQEIHKTKFGCRRGTSVSLVPTTLNWKIPNEKRNATSGKGSKNEQTRINKEKKQTAMAQFYKTIKSRMIVAEIIEKIEAGAEFTFDYVILVIVAAIIAFLGLLEDSSVILVASMLISPIMGPILAGIFGVNVRNIRLVKIGAKREIYSLLICILVGFLMGLIIHPHVDDFKSMTTQELNPTQKHEPPTHNIISSICDNVTTKIDREDLEWPTDQMTSRVSSRGLIIGVLIALPSGVAAALSVLGGNMGSLVGVAISASLLPPAVNAGLFWGMSAVEAGSPSCLDEFYNLQTDCCDTDSRLCTCRKYIWDNRVNDTFSNLYSYNNIASEYFVRGCVSLLLTLLNIVCIIIMGIICLWIKEVTPQSIPKRDSQLWEGVHYSNTIKHKMPTKEQTGLKDFFQEMDIPEENQDIFIQDAMDKLANDKDFMNIRDSISIHRDRRNILGPSYSLYDTYIGDLLNEERPPWFERLNSTQQSSPL